MAEGEYDVGLVFGPLMSRLNKMGTEDYQGCFTIDEEQWTANLDCVKKRIFYLPDQKAAKNHLVSLINQIKKWQNLPLPKKLSEFDASTGLGLFGIDSNEEKLEKLQQNCSNELVYYQFGLTELLGTYSTFYNDRSSYISKYKWSGNQIELIELLFALRLSNLIEPVKEQDKLNFPDMVYSFFSFLQVESKKKDKDVYDTVTDILHTPQKEDEFPKRPGKFIRKLIDSTDFLTLKVQLTELLESLDQKKKDRLKNNSKNATNT